MIGEAGMTASLGHRHYKDCTEMSSTGGGQLQTIDHEDRCREVGSKLYNRALTGRHRATYLLQQYGS